MSYLWDIAVDDNGSAQMPKEIHEFPEEVRGDLADALSRLNEGHKLSMPLSRPMPSIGKGVHELRFRDRAGIYRVIYVFVGGGSIYLIHAFMKKTAQTPTQNIDLAKKRLKEI
jgi:phage-related protein